MASAPLWAGSFGVGVGICAPPLLTLPHSVLAVLLKACKKPPGFRYFSPQFSKVTAAASPLPRRGEASSAFLEAGEV